MSKHTMTIQRCVQNLIEPYFTRQAGIEFCSRCGHGRGMHDTIRARLRREDKGKRGAA